MGNKKWANNTIQFPRLIAELNAAGIFQDSAIMQQLSVSMDLSDQEILGIVERAERKFDSDKRRN